MKNVYKLFLLSFSMLIISSFQAEAAKKKDKDEDKDKPNSGTISGLKFRSVGPAVASGRIADFAVNPNNPAEYYVGVAAGNVWKTTNSGTTWSPVFDAYGSWSIADVELEPGNPNVVWVGTGEYNSQRAIGYGDGVYKSTNGGKSFKNMGLKTSEHIGRILIDPRDGNTVYVAAQGPLWGPGGERGLYKTTDGGETWNNILEISPNTGVTDIVADPRNPDILYAASYQRRRHVFTLINGGPESAIYKSTDAGAHWTKLKTGLPGGDMGRIGLAISPVNPDIVYAIIEAEGEAGGFFRSTDRGESWEKMDKYVSGSPQYYNRIYCDPVDADKVYSMDTYSKVTEDGGKTWKNLSTKHKHVDDHALWIDPEHTDHILIGCDGGIYESWDAGTNWDYIENLPITQFYRVALDNSEPFYFIYGGTQDNNSLGGPSRSISGQGVVNDDWFVTNGGDGFESQIDPLNPNIVYAQSQYGWLVRYDKQSGESISIKPEPPAGEAYRWNWNSPLMVSPHSPTRLYFAANKLFRSDDRGDTWEVISPDLTRQINRNLLPVMGKIQDPEAVAKNASTSLYGSIVEIFESPVQEGLIYAGTDDGLLQVTEDGGITWTKHEHFPGVPDTTYISMIYASQHDANTVYIAYDGRKKNDLKPYLLKSTDKGKNWTNITANLPEKGTIYSFEEDYQKPELLFCGNEFGVYCSIDGGNKWIQMKSGLPTIQVRDMEIQKRENDLVLATFGRGFYVLDDYSPLRELNKEMLEDEFLMFPIKDALMFIPKRGKYNQGETYYAAENPKVAATFTYYMKETPKSLKQLRKKAEKEARKADKDIDYPDFKELRKEDLEEKASLIFTIRDEQGNIIRKIRKKPSSGINRVQWDLRHATIMPFRNKENDDFQSLGGSMRVMPGTYSVEVSLIDDGKEKVLSEATTFNVKTLDNTILPAKDKQALFAFEQETQKLGRAVRGSIREAEKAMSEIAAMRTSLENAPKATTTMRTDAKNIESELQELMKKLTGDESISKRNGNQPPSISERLGNLMYGSWRSTSAPTTTMKQASNIINTEFKPVYKQLQNIIEQKLPELRSQMESIEAPWVPGALPVYK